MLLLQLLFCDEDIIDTFVDTTVEYHSDNLLFIYDVLCGFCSKLRLIHHNVQGLWSKDDLCGWMAASADSASLFHFSKVWGFKHFILHFSSIQVVIGNFLGHVYLLLIY